MGFTEVSEVRCQICLNFPLSQVLEGSSDGNWLCEPLAAQTLKISVWCVRGGKLKHLLCDVNLEGTGLFSLSTAE